MTEIPGMVERVARELAKVAGYDPDADPNYYGDGLMTMVAFPQEGRLWWRYRREASAAIAAHEAALRDTGMVIVPKQASWMMLVAGRRAYDVTKQGSKAAAVWHAMVAAAHRCSTTNPESTSPVGGAVWQPIEAAPKDHAVLLWGVQDPHPADRIHAAGAFVFSGYWDVIDEAWCATGSTWEGPFYKPSYWQPLPAPPNGGGIPGSTSNTDETK